MVSSFINMVASLIAPLPLGCAIIALPPIWGASHHAMHRRRGERWQNDPVITGINAGVVELDQRSIFFLSNQFSVAAAYSMSSGMISHGHAARISVTRMSRIFAATSSHSSSVASIKILS